MNNKEKYEKIMKNYNRNFKIYLSIINLLFLISFIIVKIKSKNDNFSPYSPEIKKIIINDGESSKIGIISDFQLDADHIKSYSKFFEKNLFKALTVFKKYNIDIIIIAGDTTNRGKSIDYLLFKKILYSVYKYNQTPIIISLMGNHDYFDMADEDDKNRQKFFIYMKSYPYSHYIINNYNFIFWSNDNFNYEEHGVQYYSWIKETLEKARKNKNKEGDPIFVVTHMPPKNTVYGSEDMWGHEGIFNLLKDYPEVICISGHSHYSLRNKKSIWQGSFTAINTQSLSYIDLDQIYENTMAVREDSAKNDSMGLIAYLNKENIQFDRIEFSTEEIIEEKWKINFPINISNFIYTFEKRNKKIKPIFNDKNAIKVETIKEKNINKKYIVFHAAFHEDYVYIYKIIFKNKNFNREYLYYSDYYKNKKFRKEIVKFELPKNLENGKYNVEIYAIDSFNNISKPKLGIIDIDI